MTGGGSNPGAVQGPADPGSDEVAVGRDADADAVADDPQGTADGEAGAPVGVGMNVNTNDPDPTAGASDIGGLPGGFDDV